MPLAPIGFRLPDASFTYEEIDGSAVRRDGLVGAAAVVELSRDDWDDYVAQVRTFINLYLAGKLHLERGTFELLADWDPLLRLAHAGIPVYDPARVDLRDVDLARTFTLADDDDALRSYLQATGYLHLRGVFDAAEMAAANAEVDRLAAAARPGDDQSWWVEDSTGGQTLCRLVYASLRSEALAAMERDPRVARLGTLLEADGRVAPDRMEGASVVIKVPGPTKGLANIPWHQDCGMGGHAILCPAVSVGIQLTGSSEATGNLRVVPGSHGQTLHFTWERRLHDVPVVAIDTEPGDVTVHVQDVMHASPEPTGAGGRRTLYVTHYPPTLWDHVGPGEAFNDLVRNRTAEAARLQ